MTQTTETAAALADWLIDRAEKLEGEGYQNGADGSRAWGEAAEALLDQRAALLEALELAEDVLSRFPYSGELWPNGTHPNTGIEAIRAAIAKANGPPVVRS